MDCRIRNNPLFELYYNLLAEWNQRFNLTSIIEKDDVYLKHFYDSILPADLIPEGSKVLDIGSGAGFPAIPLKIIIPSLDITMTDSVGKKVNFLNYVICELNLSKIKALHTRIEDLKEKTFDIVTARAVAPLNILAEYSLPFLKTGGFLLAYKAQNTLAEAEECKNALDVLGGCIDGVFERRLDDSIMRRFVILKKIRPTPEGFPRGQNKPRLKPL